MIGKTQTSLTQEGADRGRANTKAWENDPYAFPPLTPTGPQQTLSRPREAISQTGSSAQGQTKVTSDPTVTQPYDASASLSSSPHSQHSPVGPQPPVPRSQHGNFVRPGMSRQDSFGGGKVKSQQDAFGHSPTSVPGARPHLYPTHQQAQQQQQQQQQVLAATDPYSHQPATPRPQTMPDPYSHPPSTPRPQAMPASDPYSHPPSTPRPQMMAAADPYSHPPSTPRPKTMASADPYSHPPSTPRPPQSMADPYSHPPSTPRPAMPQDDPYAHQPPSNRPAVPPQFMQAPPGGAVREPLGMSHPRPRMADPFGGHTPRGPGPAEMVAKQQISPTDPYAHQPPTPRKQQQADMFGRHVGPDMFGQPPPMSQESALSPDIHQIISNTRQCFMDDRQSEMAAADQAMVSLDFLINTPLPNTLVT